MQRLLKQSSKRLSLMFMSLVLSSAVASLPSYAANDCTQGQSKKCQHGEILWDGYGVPHIYGQDIPDVLQGYGYAQMENHAELLLQLVAIARGRAAEYFGPGTNNALVTSDIRIRVNNVPWRSNLWYQTGGQEQQRYLDAFVAGINKYATDHSETISPVFRQVLPVTPQDILGAIQNQIHFSIMLQQSRVSELIAAWTAGTISAANGATVAGNAINGSNGWALAPTRTTSGNAILMGNPHLPWGVNQPIAGLGSFQWFEAHLVTNTLNAHGVTFVGGPFIGIGFNDDLGWTHTNNWLKNADLYELTLVQGGYLWEGRVLPLRQRQDQLKIRLPDGSFQTQTLNVFSSIHGPIVAQKGNKALALRVAGLYSPSIVSQYWDMMRARNFGEFKAANSRLQMPFFNVVYADRHGDIMYLSGGQQPIRSGGQFADWAGILPGDSASALWTDVFQWKDLPKTVNPSSGFVQNCNDPPWTSTFPQTILPQNFPGYIAPQLMALRPQHCALFLMSKQRFSADDVLQGKMSTHMELAARLLPDLIAAAKVSGNAMAIAAANVLETWDGNSDAGSRGAALFERWYRIYTADPTTPKSSTLDFEGGVYPAFRINWSPSQPLTTPQGLADAPSAIPALVLAAQQLQQQFGAIDVPWGAVHRMVLVTHDATFASTIPLVNDAVSGSDIIFGGIRIVWPFPAPDKVHQFSFGGDGYVQLVEFTRAGPKAKTLLTYGNASRLGSSHITDQLKIFSEKGLRPVLRTRDEVEVNAVSHESF